MEPGFFILTLMILPGLLPGALLYFFSERIARFIRLKFNGRVFAAIILIFFSVICYALGGMIHGPMMSWWFAPATAPWYLSVIPPGLRPSLDTPPTLVFLSVFCGLYLVPGLATAVAVLTDVPLKHSVRAAATVIAALSVGFASHDFSERGVAPATGRCPNFAGDYVLANNWRNRAWCGKQRGKISITQNYCNWMIADAPGFKNVPVCMNGYTCFVRDHAVILPNHTLIVESDSLTLLGWRKGGDAADSNSYRHAHGFQLTPAGIELTRASAVTKRYVSNIFHVFANAKLDSCEYEKR